MTRITNILALRANMKSYNDNERLYHLYMLYVKIWKKMQSFDPAIHTWVPSFRHTCKTALSYNAANAEKWINLASVKKLRLSLVF